MWTASSRGTMSLNPLPSSGESANFQSLSGGRIGVRTSSRLRGHAGVPGLIEAFRQTGTAAVIDREIQLKSRKRGLSAAEMELLPSVKHVRD